MYLYVNGVLEAYKNMTGNLIPFSNDNVLNMGRWANSANNYRRFDGSMDEVSIWNIALTSTQINNIKSNPESVTGASYNASGLIGYWNFDNLTATDLTSSHNNGIAGTGTNLPVELLYFEANYVEDNVYLDWATASELNNDYFVVERTTDQFLDNANWEEVGRVTGAGTTNIISKYLIIDADINTNNKIIYYRLKQVDFDGKFEFSNIVAISPQGKNEIHVYPNPSIGLFRIQDKFEIQNSNVEVYNSLGQLIFSFEYSKGMEIDIRNQPNGIYMIRLGEGLIRIAKNLVHDKK